MTSLKRIWYLIPPLHIQKLHSDYFMYNLYRFTSNEANQNPNLVKRSKIIESLKTKFPLAKEIKVIDTSGGCGQMFDIEVETIEFEGLTTLKQHKLVNEILKEEIKHLHGLRIFTKVPTKKD